MATLRSASHLLRLIPLLAAWAVVAPIAWLLGRRRSAAQFWVSIAAAGALLMAAKSCSPGDSLLRIATFNIDNFGKRKDGTDEQRLEALLREIDADVIAVQEIRDPQRFDRLVRRVGGGRRRYGFVPSHCGGDRGMHVGFVIDEARVRLIGTDEYPELEPGDDDRCSIADRPGLLGHFESAGRHFELLVVHFAAMPNQAEKRRTQWGRVLRIAGERHRAGVPVAIIGDVNSTGFRDDVAGERTFIREKVAAAGMRLVSDGIACSEYYTPDGHQHLEPSALDHIAVTPDFPVVGTATVRSYCVETRCHPIHGARPADFVAVSDHCPVVVGGP